jgi:hypothetical protein
MSVSLADLEKTRAKTNSHHTNNISLRVGNHHGV